MTIQATTKETTKRAVPTDVATGRRRAGVGPGGKQKKIAKKRIAKPRATKESKAGSLLNLLRRKNGASIAELQKATDWQPHSVRGFLSGTVKRRLGLQLRSERTGKGERRYLIAKL